MLSRTGQALYFAAQYVASKVGKTGLTVTYSVYNLPSATPVATGTAVEVAGGIYCVSYTPAVAGEYVCVFTTADVTVDQRDLAVAAWAGKDWVQHVDAAISTRSDFDSTTDAVTVGLIGTDAVAGVATIQAGLATSAQLTTVDGHIPTTAAIDAALTAAHGSGAWTTSGLTAANIWAYATRSLTGSVNVNITSIEDIAEEVDELLTTMHGSGAWNICASSDSLLAILSQRTIEGLIEGAGKPDIVIYKGNSAEINVLVRDKFANPIDLTTASAVFTVRKTEITAGTPLISKALTIPHPLQGAMLLNLGATDTALAPDKYIADIKLTFTSGEVKTVWKANFVVLQDVTH